MGWYPGHLKNHGCKLCKYKRSSQICRCNIVCETAIGASLSTTSAQHQSALGDGWTLSFQLTRFHNRHRGSIQVLNQTDLSGKSMTSNQAICAENWACMSLLYVTPHPSFHSCQTYGSLCKHGTGKSYQLGSMKKVQTQKRVEDKSPHEKSHYLICRVDHSDWN